MDATQALRDAENALRDFIAAVLIRSFGPDWIDKCGVSLDRITKWHERKAVEEQRQEAGVVEERLIYYADFFDIKTILKKNWAGELKEALGDWKTFETHLDDLEKLRDADAHRRELLPHQKNLAIGISGEIRNRIVRYRSKRETPEDCFPRIESVRDSLGHIWTPATGQGTLGDRVITDVVLRPGDVLDFVVTATDPEDLPLQFSLDLQLRDKYKSEWQDEPTFSLRITEEYIQKNFCVILKIRSPRKYHAKFQYDDEVIFHYQVLPRASLA